MTKVMDLLTDPLIKGTVKIEVSGTDLLDFGKEIVRSALEKAESDKKEPDKEELLTPEETCEYLKVCKTTLWHWRRKNVLNSYRIGNKCLYKKSEILARLTLINDGGNSYD